MRPSFLLAIATAASIAAMAHASGLCRKASDQADLDADRRATAQCIAENAKRLEPSREAAPDIATAAIAACEPELRASAAIVEARCSRLRSGILDWGVDPDIAAAFDEHERELARGLAVRVVTEIRARVGAPTDAR